MLSIDTSQVIMQIVSFLMILWVMKRFGWKPLLDTMQARKDTIHAEFDAIALKHDEADQLLLEYQTKLKEIEKEARFKIQEAIIEGRKIGAQIEREAEEKAREILEKTKSEVVMEVAEAKVQLKEDIANFIVGTTEKILHEKLDDNEQSKLIARFIDEAGSLQ
jgi:F-type H+-transporting ATPase subunit b